MSDQMNPLSNEPVVEFESSTTEQLTKTNGSALFGMVFAVLPTISFILLLASVFILLKFARPGTWEVWIEVFALLIGVFMLVSYPLSFILGMIGLRQISKSKGRQEGKKLAWTAIALSSSYCLLIWVFPFSSLIYKWTFNRDTFFPPVVTMDTQPTNVPVMMQRSTLSGVWTGTQTLTAVGSCKLEQGDSVTNPAEMLWKVNDEGEVTVILTDWSGVYPYTFRGEVQPDLRVSLEFSTSASCGGYENPYSATYESIIRADGDTFRLEMEATEAWCPGTCIFLRHYSVQKTNTAP